jgi:signal transduction histidine kinase
VVTGADGWWVAGKFDQYRRDLESGGLYQAFCALGRLLLAEPEDELAAVHERLLTTLGPNAGLAAAILPEFATVLGVPPDAGDPLTAQLRTQRTAVEILRAVASRKRPVVVFVDDLQWAGRTPLGVVDLLLSEDPVEGLLLVGAYREDDVDATHPLAALLSRWRDQTGLRQLRLDNLPAPSLARMVAEMLRADPAVAQGLARLLGPHTAGNPYETVELLDALRRAGALTVAVDGWRWDDAAVRAHLGEADAAALSTTRATALPPSARAIVEAMACLGGQAELRVLQAATGQPLGAVEQALAPALHEGLLVAEPGAQQAVRFRHDRLREATLGQLDPLRRSGLQLGMARRLAGVPELFSAAAEQYLPVADAVLDGAERWAVVGLLRRAADQAALIGDHARVDTLLSAALRLVDSEQTATLVAMHTGRHAALYSLGRLEEADEEYRTIEGLCPAGLDRAAATAVQVLSLTHQTRLREAVDLGLASLRELGIDVPTADRLAVETDRQFGHLYRWLDGTDPADDLTRPEITDPELLAVGALLNALAPAAYFAGNQAAFAWLSLEPLRIWLDHGLCPALVGVAGHVALSAVELRGDYAAGFRALRRIVAVGEARGYEPATSVARFLFAHYIWSFEPIEEAVQEAQRAREGLLAGGDLANAGYTYRAALSYVLDCAPGLDDFLSEVEAGLSFARRTGNAQVGQSLDSYRWLAGVLRGEGPVAAEAAVPAERSGNPMALFATHLTRAVAAAIFGDPDGLARHTAAAMPLTGATAGRYAGAVTRLLRGLALAVQAGTASSEERGVLLVELDEQIGWLAERAVDAPDNFAHLVRLLEAERAWTTGGSWTAVLAFDAALREVMGRQRSWHRALIAERAARFHLGHGLAHTGRALLAEARQAYAGWGATAKVAQLDWAYPGLQPGAATATLGPDQPADDVAQRSTVSTGTLDLLGILAASQALSSQTSIDRLHARVVEVLVALTGATDVHLPLWDEDGQDWLLPTPTGTLPAGGGHETAVPLSVLRYVQRTKEPLVVADATADDRFARDPYLVDADCCSLRAVPILSRGALRAVLLLENRLLRGAFTAERSDAVELIAGQLAVSLDNAQVYTDFRRVADEQAALRRVATLVAQGEPPSTVLAAVAQEAGQLLSADLVLIGRYGDGPSVTAIVGWRHDGRPVPLGKDVRLGGQNVMSAVFSSGGPVRIEAYSQASGAVSRWSQAAGIGSAVGVPIMVEGRLWGVIMIALEHERPWQADTESRLANFTDLAATAIGNVSAREQLREVADEQAALRRVATLVARGAAPDVIFGAVAQEVAHVLPAVDHAVIGRYTSHQSVEFVGGWKRAGGPDWVGKTTALGGHNVSTAVFETLQPARVDHLDDEASPTTAIARNSGARSSAGAPINVEGRLWGVMIVASAHAAELPAGIERELADFIELLATAIANTQAREEVRASRARIVAAADQARRRIERDVHDGAQQRLVSLGLQLRTAQASVPPELGELRAELDRAIDATTAAMEELQEIARGIHPAVLAQGGLRTALKTLARRAAIPVHLDLGAVGRLPDHIEISAYYVVAETLTNAAKHANASAVTVEVGYVDDILRIAVRDDGIGGADFTRGSGLLGLKDRLEAIGGRILLDSPRDGGTEVTAELPLAGTTAGNTRATPSPAGVQEGQGSTREVRPD